MIPFGTGTSLEGHVAALNGGISIDTCNLNTIKVCDEQDFFVTVGAGVTRLKLNDALRHTG
jgi:D-lactate dehydrogenase (cytochrome)